MEILSFNMYILKFYILITNVVPIILRYTYA